MGPASRLDLSPGHKSPETPSFVGIRNEEKEQLHLALLCLDPEDQEILHLRQWQKLEYADIGQRLGLDANTARMRFQRTLPKLAKMLETIGKHPK